MSYGPGLYAVRLPPGARSGRGLALCRRHGDYDRAEQAWYITVALPGAYSENVRYALAELAGLGAVITKHDQEESP